LGSAAWDPLLGFLAMSLQQAMVSVRLLLRFICYFQFFCELNLDDCMKFVYIISNRLQYLCH
jgi:hypothetical protein